MTAVTDADRIAADGEQITLADGSTRTIRFDLRAMLGIERRFGSVGMFSRKLERGMATGGIEPTLAGLEIALQGEPKLSEDELGSALDPKRFTEYQDAVALAFMQALPKTEESGKESAPANNSPGEISTDSPGRLSAVPMASSGA